MPRANPTGIDKVEFRGKRYHLRYQLPVEVRWAFPTAKRKNLTSFNRTLDTIDPEEAEIKAGTLVAIVKERIVTARRNDKVELDKQIERYPVALKGILPLARNDQIKAVVRQGKALYGALRNSVDEDPISQLPPELRPEGWMVEKYSAPNIAILSATLIAIVGNISKRKHYEQIRSEKYPQWEDKIRYITTHIPPDEAKAIFANLAVAAEQKQVVVDLIDEFIKRHDVKPHGKKQARQTLIQLAERYPLLEEWTIPNITKWKEHLEDFGNEKIKGKPTPLSQATVSRKFSECSSFWKYCVSHGHITQETVNPFAGRGFKKKKNRVKRKEWTADQIVHLYNEASSQVQNAKERTKKRRLAENLRDLILVAAYTGARLSEIMNLKVKFVETRENVRCFHFAIDERGQEVGKTEAATRIFPVHSDIKDVVERLFIETADGYLISGESADNQFNDRSAAIGKRFGMLKARLGYEEQVEVFHSFKHALRSTLANNAADIEIGMQSEIIDYMCAHEGGSVGARVYQHYWKMEHLQKIVETIEYPWVNNLPPFQ